MIALRVTSKGSGKDRRYYLRWELPEVDAAGQPMRYEGGRPKMRRFQEACQDKGGHITDQKTIEVLRMRRWRIVNGLDVPAEPVKHTTMDELIDLDTDWLKNRERAEGTIYLSRLALTAFRDILGGAGRPLHAETLTPLDVELFIRERRKAVSATTVNNELNALKATWNRAIKRKVLTTNPFAGVEKMEEIPRPIVPLTREEEQRLLAACVDDLELETFVRLALDSGARAGELAAMPISCIRLDDGVALVECNSRWKSKSRRNRYLPFTPETGAVLQRWLLCRVGKAYVFREEGEHPRTPYLRLYRAFTNAVARAGIARHVTPHDLRRTVGSLLAARGVNQRVAMELLGHADIGTTAKYYQSVSAETLKGVVVNLRPTGTESGK